MFGRKLRDLRDQVARLAQSLDQLKAGLQPQQPPDLGWVPELLKAVGDFSLAEMKAKLEDRSAARAARQSWARAAQRRPDGRFRGGPVSGKMPACMFCKDQYYAGPFTEQDILDHQKHGGANHA